MLSDRPGTNSGEYTAPKSKDLPSSGFSGKFRYLAPENKPLPWPCSATVWLRNVPSSGTFTQAGFGVVAPSQGSLPRLEVLFAGMPKMSWMLGARNTEATVPRSIRSVIGFHSNATFQLFVLPAMLYLE